MLVKCALPYFPSGKLVDGLQNRYFEPGRLAEALLITPYGNPSTKYFDAVIPPKTKKKEKIENERKTRYTAKNCQY